MWSAEAPRNIVTTRRPWQPGTSHMLQLPAERKVPLSKNANHVTRTLADPCQFFSFSLQILPSCSGLLSSSISLPGTHVAHRPTALFCASENPRCSGLIFLTGSLLPGIATDPVSDRHLRLLVPRSAIVSRRHDDCEAQLLVMIVHPIQNIVPCLSADHPPSSLQTKLDARLGPRRQVR